MSDVHLLHDVVTDLQLKNTEIVHSLENQLTYVKTLSTSSKINAEANANLSTVLRDQVIQSHDELQNFARDILWLNASLFEESTLIVHVREMELTLLQLAHTETILLCTKCNSRKCFYRTCESQFSKIL